jgi:hypothetical protein
MKPSSVAVAVFCLVLGLAVGLNLAALGQSGHERPVAAWLEVTHRVATAVGGLGAFLALVVVVRQFYLLRTQSELVQKNVLASVDAQLYARLDSFNRFVFEHSAEYDLLDSPFPQLESQAQRSRLHRMCEMGFTFFEEIFKHHARLRLLETEDWDEWEENLRHFFGKPYVRGYWKAVADRYMKSYQGLVNELVGRLEHPETGCRGPGPPGGDTGRPDQERVTRCGGVALEPKDQAGEHLPKVPEPKPGGNRPVPGR